MRAIVQRVSSASVDVDGKRVGSVSAGLLVYLGVSTDESENDVDYLVDKVAGLRIFPDRDGKMNLDVVQVHGQVLVVSAFTLMADARKGRRPGFEAAAGAELALPLYERFCELLASRGLMVARGEFGAMMQVDSTNDGPVCILLDSKKLF
jgi:D-tyrosyl-tRNA(Tyr) deacylase